MDAAPLVMEIRLVHSHSAGGKHSLTVAAADAADALLEVAAAVWNRLRGQALARQLSSSVSICRLVARVVVVAVAVETGAADVAPRGVSVSGAVAAAAAGMAAAFVLLVYQPVAAAGIVADSVVAAATAAAAVAVVVSAR